MKKLLFLCVANSVRSQMAEGLARAMFKDQIEVQSAGSQPFKVNPLAIEVMHEIGIDISSHHSKCIDDVNVNTFDLIITLCRDEVCPIVPSRIKKLHWPLPDPTSDSDVLQAFRNTRDQIRERLEKLARELGLYA